MSIPSTILSSDVRHAFGATSPHHKDLASVNLFDQSVDTFQFCFSFVALRFGNNTTAICGAVDFSEQAKYIIRSHFNNNIYYKES